MYIKHHKQCTDVDYWYHALIHLYTKPTLIFTTLLMIHRVEASITDHLRASTPSLEKYKGHFTHETKSMWPLHFKHSHWWKGRSWSKFASHYAWITTGACECKMDVRSTWIHSYMASAESCFMVTWTIFKKLPLGGRPNTKPRDCGTPNAHNHWFNLFYHVWGPTWIENHWNSIRLRAQSHMTSHYTWGSVTTLHDVGGVSGRLLDAFVKTLATPWSLWRPPSTFQP